MANTVIGRVVATEKNPTTIDNFTFWTDPELMLKKLTMPLDLTIFATPLYVDILKCMMALRVVKKSPSL